MMSFDLYAQCFRAGEMASFPRQWLDSAFGNHAHQTVNSDLIVLTYPDGGGDLYVNGGDVHSFSINRPGGVLLFNDLFELMQKASLVIYWPSLTPSLTVADVGVVVDLPKEIVEVLGPARIIASGAEIVALITSDHLEL